MIQVRAMCSVVVLLTACGGADVGHTGVHRGEVCRAAAVGPSGPGAGTFNLGGPVTVQFDACVCLDTCTRDSMAECQVTRTGDALAITTRGSWVDTSASENGCGLKCEHVSASCDAGALPAGTYTVQYNTKVLTLEVPSQLAAAPCLRQGG